MLGNSYIYASILELEKYVKLYAKKKI